MALVRRVRRCPAPARAPPSPGRAARASPSGAPSCAAVQAIAWIAKQFVVASSVTPRCGSSRARGSGPRRSCRRLARSTPSRTAADRRAVQSSVREAVELADASPCSANVRSRLQVRRVRKSFALGRAGRVELHLALAPLDVEELAPEALAVDLDAPARDARRDRLRGAARANGRSTAASRRARTGTASDRREKPHASRIGVEPRSARSAELGRRVERRRSDEVSTTSNAEPGTRPSVWRSSFDQRGSGAPETYQSEPLSATIIPYSFSARSTIRACRGKPEMSKSRLSRSRAPIGGSAGSVERAREVARRPDVGAPRARDGEAQRVVDPAARDLVVAGEARAGSAARRRRPTSSRPAAAGSSAGSRSRPSRPSSARPTRRSAKSS